MSKATKRKYVTQEVLGDFVLPDEHRFIVQVIGGRGNNLHEVKQPSGETFLASMPTKFRKNVWIKRGDFVLVESIDEGDKVKAEISHILYKEQIRYIKDEGKWPEGFDETPKDKDGAQSFIPADMLPPSDSSDEEGDGQETMESCNPNRNVVTYEESSSEEEDEDT